MNGDFPSFKGVPVFMGFSATLDTGLHADCVKFVPTGKEAVAVVACYELDEAMGRRAGRLIVAKHSGSAVYWTGTDARSTNTDYCSEVCDEISDIPGVLDIYWFPGTTLLVTALAEGAPRVFQLDSESLRLTDTQTPVDMPSENMTLAVSGRPESFLTCDNRGFLRQWTMDSALRPVREWRGHEAEVWHVAMDRHDGNLFYSGSDDMTLRFWDLRVPADGNDPVAVLTNRSHEAGVCCIEPSPWDEHVLATGSYDERLRVWDRRMMRHPEKTIECGSGVWRIAWNRQRRDLLGVAAMRAGFHVVDLTDTRICQTERVDDHVAYGIDWHEDGRQLASCSFYNNQAQFFAIN